MHRLNFILLTILLSVNVLAQTSANDFGKISLNVVLPENKDIPEEAQRLLETKLKQIVTRNGIADNGINERFVITAKTSIIEKDIAPSMPPRISQKLELTFIIGDVLENKIYETASITLSGMGTNETKAFISAFQNIIPDNKFFTEMTQKAKEKIAQYYNVNCEKYFQKAKVLEKSQHFAEAVYTLAQVPDVSENCYNRAQEKAMELVVMKINFDAETLLKQAQAQWAGANTLENATKTLEILGQINVMAACQSQVQTLITTINDKLRADEKREWEFKMQQYNDAKAREQRDFDFQVKKHDDKHQLSKQGLEVVREVALAFAKNQPKTNSKEKVKSW